MVEKRDRPLKRALREAGGLSVLASLLGITPQAVSQWRHVPAARVLAVERATKGAVSRFQLRPDLYPPDSA
jgi:DNA-binding transcriptional regulator YdaS (Cro superfamily)